MLAALWTGLVRAMPSLGLLATVFVGPGHALAQQTGPAPDGLTFESQSARTRQDFTGTFGPGCAAQAWVWQHTLALDPDMLDGPAASDGLKLVDQDDDLQLAFVAHFGLQANAEWVAERNAFLAHKVLLNNVAPMPCPPARPARPTDVIATGHLANAVAAARDGEFDETLGNLLAFRTIWGTVKADVVKRAPAAAQSVQTALDQAVALLGDPKAPEPAQDQYYPAMQNLRKVVQDANTLLGH